MRIADTRRASARVSLCSLRRPLCQRMTIAPWRATLTCLGTVALLLGAAARASAQPAVEPTAPLPPEVETAAPLPPVVEPAAPLPPAAETAAPRPPVAEDAAPRPRVGAVIEVQGFGLVPLGTWSQHIYETNMPGLSLRQFGPGGGGALTFGLRNVPRPKWDLLLRAQYGVLGTGAWERYAAAHGSNVSTSARLANVGLLLTRDIDLSPSFRLAVGGGPGVAWGSGEETDPATGSYDYTMLQTAASLTVVARGILALSPVFSLVGELAGVVGTTIVSYGSDDDRALTALAGGVGVRVTP